MQHLIEKCLIFHMTKEECMEALSKHANINPVITSTGMIFSLTTHLLKPNTMHTCNIPACQNPQIFYIFMINTISISTYELDQLELYSEFNRQTNIWKIISLTCSVFFLHFRVSKVDFSLYVDVGDHIKILIVYK